MGSGHVNNETNRHKAEDQMAPLDHFYYWNACAYLIKMANLLKGILGFLIKIKPAFSILQSPGLLETLH